MRLFVAILSLISPLCLNTQAATPSHQLSAPSHQLSAPSRQPSTLRPGKYEYTGHAPYRLFIARHSDPVFNPDQDLRRAEAGEDIKTKLHQKVAEATVKSLIPIMGTLSGSLTGTEKNLLSSLETTSSILANSIKESVSELNKTGYDRKYFPALHDLYLIPWTTAERDLFYSSEKISIGSGELVNTLRAAPFSKNFEENITKSIKELQRKMLAEREDPVLFFGMRSVVFINPNATSKLTIRLLLGLKPDENIPFEKNTPEIRIRKAVIPRIADRSTTAALTLTFDLSENTSTPPTLEIEFGDFKEFKDGQFLMEKSEQAKHGPRLEGTVNKRGAKWIGVDFTFQKMTFSLESMRISKLETLTSAGFRVGKAHWTRGAFSIQKVNDEFLSEINNTIDSQIQEAINSGSERLNNGMIDLDLIREAMNIIFGRQ